MVHNIRVQSISQTELHVTWDMPNEIERGFSDGDECDRYNIHLTLEGESKSIVLCYRGFIPTACYKVNFPVKLRTGTYDLSITRICNLKFAYIKTIIPASGKLETGATCSLFQHQGTGTCVLTNHHALNDGLDYTPETEKVRSDYLILPNEVISNPIECTSEYSGPMFGAHPF